MLGGYAQIGYICVARAMGRFEYFDFALICQAYLTINEIIMLEYRSTYCHEIGSKAWLKQFLRV